MSLEDTIDRYHRQELIDGWNQEALNGSKIAVIGSDILSNYVALNLAALGFGKIEIYGKGKVDGKVMSSFNQEGSGPDYGEGFLYFSSEENKPKAEAAAEFIKNINPFIETVGVDLDLSRMGNISVIGIPDIIIDTTNDPASKIETIDYGLRRDIPVISMSSSGYYSGLGLLNRPDRDIINNIIFSETAGKDQGSTTSQLISALGVDEARKILMPLRNEQVLDDIIIYNLGSDSRFDRNVDRNLSGRDDFSSKTAVMVGAGALGNFLGLDLALNNIGHLYIIDFDEVEATNLNRQVWYYDSVGRNKAEALAGRLGEINPRVRFTYIKEKIVPESEEFFRDTHIDLLVDTVDNNKTRALLNYFSQKYEIPFISGGTSYNSGQAIVSIPGKTACLNCQTDIDKSALNAHTPHQSCIYAPQPSVITSNQVIAGLMGGEAKQVFHPDRYGEPVKFVLKYISGEKYRLGTLPQAPLCNCRETSIDGWMEKMKHLYEEN